MEKHTKTVLIALTIVIILTLTISLILSDKEEENNIQTLTIDPIDEAQKFHKSNTTKKPTLKKIIINSNLSLKTLELNLEEKNIIIKPKNVHIKDNNLKLKISTEDQLLIKEFTGRIIINETLYLSGNFLEYSTLPINIQQETPIELFIDYYELEIEDVTIKNLEETHQGTIRIDNSEIDLNEDLLYLNEFIGSLIVKDKKIFLNGNTKSIEIEKEKYNFKID
ncbi:hypothetical protein CL617_03955 [archaeon]|nr:hypothetical protein [archaeon]|tara:strand:- start:6265 stop:6933 length:669 start_codon:yes stop_codon:yes gene_type:complete